MTSIRILVGLAVVLVAAFVFEVAQPSNALPAASVGGPDASVQAYKWVDSLAAGCKAPSLIGPGVPPVGSPLLPAKGCPLGWDEITSPGCPGCSRIYQGKCCSSTDAWYAANNFYTAYYLGCCGSWYPFYYYGVQHIGSSFFPAYYVEVNTNGFLRFVASTTFSGEGTPSNTPKLMPTAGSETGGVNSAPENVIAAYWTDMYAGTSYYSNSVCPGDSSMQGIYTQQKGFAPNRYLVIEYNQMRVVTGSTYDGTGGNPSPSAAQTAFCALPHSYATFEIKLYETTSNIDIIYKDVNNNGQQVSMGIENTGGTIGLNYAFDTSSVMTDRAVRYYPKHNPIATAKSITLSEDCYVLANWPATPCAAPGTPVAVDPATVASDPDYGDTVTFTVTSPGKGQVNPTGSSTAPCSAGTCTYSPYPNFNGADSFTYSVTSSDGSSAGPATISLTTNPINDRAIGVPTCSPMFCYNVNPNDFLFQPAAGLLTGARDPEYGVDRATWGTYPVPSAASMTEGGPSEVLKTFTTSCPGYSAAAYPTGWKPAYGVLNFVNTDGSFQYTPNTGFTGLDYFKFCIADVDAGTGSVFGYSPAYTVKLDVSVLNPNVIAKSDAIAVNEDVLLDAQVPGALAPKNNDLISGSATGVNYVLVGPPPANAATFTWFSNGGFKYQANPDWFGVDFFQYKVTTGNMGDSNVANVVVTVNPVNDKPSFTWYQSAGDTIAEDNGNPGAPPPPYLRTVNNFIKGVSVGPANEQASQQARVVIVSQTNSLLFNKVGGLGWPAPSGGTATPGLTCPANFPWTYPPLVCPTGTAKPNGPQFALAGAPGSQAAALTYTTLPDAYGVDTVCFVIQDNGGVAFGGADQDTPTSAPTCFDLTLTAVDDKPRPAQDKYTIYKNHILTAPMDAFPPPISIPAVTGLFEDHGFGPDLEMDGQPFKSYVFTQPTKGALTGSAIGQDGSFKYTPNVDSLAADQFQYRLQDAGGTWSNPAKVDIIVLDNIKPTATFTASTYDGLAGATISFVSLCSDDGPIKLWLWDFGDGAQSLETSPSHVYANPGTYTVKLTCVDAKGDIATMTKTITISWGTDHTPESTLADTYGTGLVAFAGENQNVPEGAKITLHGTVNGAFSGATIRYAWTQMSGPPVVLNDATTADPWFTAPAFTGAAPQALLFGLTASDGVAQSLPSLVQVTVHSTNHAPVADAGPEQDVVAGMTATLDATATVDPDGDKLTYTWTQLAGLPVELSDIHGAKPSFVTPAYDGTPLIFQLVVDDGDARASSLARVLAIPPAVAASGFTYDVVRTEKGNLVTFHTNVEGDSYVWDFGDGLGSSLEQEPTYLYTHAGTYTVRLSVVGSGEPQAFERDVGLGLSASRDVADPVLRESPAAGPLFMLALAACALVAGRRKA